MHKRFQIIIAIVILVFFGAIFTAPISKMSNSDISQTEVITSTADTNITNSDQSASSKPSNPLENFEPSTLPAYSGNASCVVNNNIPHFTDDELTTASFETYSDLDTLGRCGAAYANISKEIMPTQERGKIGDVRPSGWHTKKYNGIIDGNYLYNRCHLIAYQLAGENANTRNLITGTRYMNTEGMAPYENAIGDYVNQTGNHVLYRVTPVFEEENLVASGVLLEAKSVEDNGTGVMFHVYCYNVQPGIEIDYATGESRLDGTLVAENDAVAEDISAAESASAAGQTSAAGQASAAGQTSAAGQASAVGQASAEKDDSPETDVSASTTEQSSTDTTEVTPQQPQGSFAVNNKNGKIHKVGVCTATGTDDNAMKSPVYFNTYDEAIAYSQSVAPNQEKRNCGNCW